MGKRGQYFTIDAFIALLVISIGLLLIFAVNSSVPDTAQPQVLSQGIVNLLGQTKIKEINNDFVQQQVRGGNITNTDNTLLQQAFEFKQFFDSNSVIGYDPQINSNLSAEFLESVTAALVPQQYNFEVRIDGDKIYGRGVGQDSTDLLVSSKQIAFGVINKSDELWGPVIVEVRVWQ